MISDPTTIDRGQMTHRWITTGNPKRGERVQVILEMPNHDRHKVLLMHREVLELIRDLSAALEEALYGE